MLRHKSPPHESCVASLARRSQSPETSQRPSGRRTDVKRTRRSMMKYKLFPGVFSISVLLEQRLVIISSMPKDCSKKFTRAICREQWGATWHSTNKTARLNLASEMYRRGGAPTTWHTFDAKAFVTRFSGTLCSAADTEPVYPMCTMLEYTDEHQWGPPGFLSVNNSTIYDSWDTQKRVQDPIQALEPLLRVNCCTFGHRCVHIVGETWARMSAEHRQQALHLKCPCCNRQVQTVYTNARVPGEN